MDDNTNPAPQQDNPAPVDPGMGAPADPVVPPADPAPEAPAPEAPAPEAPVDPAAPAV